MLNPTEKRLHRAKIAAFLGVILFFASWIIGGYYYLTDYGSIIKPIIKFGTQPWIHGVFMEAKEHIFLFLPFISILVYSLISGFQSSLGKNKNIPVQKSILILSLLILLIGFLMGLLGYLISSGYR
ncbi:hypothetical protein EXS72_00615 [Candidatus Pacearchaeota archaeon]|nr:hypothetical protein [Candidatus Pacearchaeota archaeon]